MLYPSIRHTLVQSTSRKMEKFTIIIVFVTVIPSVYLISNEIANNQSGNVSEIILNLANLAVESRQNRPHLDPNRIKYPSYYQNIPHGQYGLLQYPLKPHYGYPPPDIRPQRPALPPYPNSQPSVMDILYSISRNDRLRCVPRLLCEVTSGAISRASSRQNFGLPSLPIQFNLESIIGILSTIDAASGSPVTSFAKAALLGYSSKGNSDSCITAYPQCPKDPDRLVQYLNNYNGGFFRYFSGINPLMAPSPINYGSGSPYQPLPPQYQSYSHPYNNLIATSAEQRIQNKPVEYIAQSNFVIDNVYGNNEGVIFPSENVKAGFNLNTRSPKTLSFPNNDRFNEFTYYERPKQLPFSINHYHSNELDLQRPPANHKASPMIFPVRTGTGDLRLDPEEFNQNHHSYHHQNNDNVVRFNPDNDGVRGGRGLIFPV